jgi:exodeoxyribonuclease VIII
MLDLETMGVNADALITTISAVRFDLKSGQCFEEFETGLNWEEQIEHGAIIDSSTVQWWLKQSKEAQETMMRLPQNRIIDVLQEFNGWITKYIPNIKNAKLWGNGVTFDNTLLRNLYKRHGVDFVLPYYCDNDVRTLVTLKGINPRDYEFKGIKHRGIDDCKHQIFYCCEG